MLVEEFLKGEEMSYFIITDGKTIKSFGTAQDHKRVKEGDKEKILVVWVLIPHQD